MDEKPYKKDGEQQTSYGLQLLQGLAFLGLAIALGVGLAFLIAFLSLAQANWH